MKHLSTCKHSTLEASTRKYKRRKIKHIPGTKRIVLVDDTEPKPKAKKRRKA